jgi:hypothetical protein
LGRAFFTHKKSKKMSFKNTKKDMNQVDSLIAYFLNQAEENLAQNTLRTYWKNTWPKGPLSLEK